MFGSEQASAGYSIASGAARTAPGKKASVAMSAAASSTSLPTRAWCFRVSIVHLPSTHADGRRDRRTGVKRLRAETATSAGRSIRPRRAQLVPVQQVPSRKPGAPAANALRGLPPPLADERQAAVLEHPQLPHDAVAAT